MDIAIIDNNKARATALSDLIKHSLPMANGGGYTVSVNTQIFTSGIDFVSDYKPVYDAIFIETDLPLVTGIAVARGIRKTDNCVSIVLVSDTDKYAINGYDVGAAGYLVRPVDYVKLSNVFINVISARNNVERDTVFIHIKNGLRKVFADDVCYVEARGHSLVYKLRREEVTGIGTLAEIEESLANVGFFRCNKSFIVNPVHITELSGGVITCGGAEITVSRQRLKSFKTYYSMLYDSDEKTVRAEKTTVYDTI